MSNPTFDASARHCITLPPEHGIASVLASGGSRCALLVGLGGACFILTARALGLALNLRAVQAAP